MSSISIVFCVFVVLLSVNMVQATIIHVPTQQPTIQAGINASVNGDTVLVAPGTYYEHINFNGKAILLKSEAGAEATIINKLTDGTPIVSFVSSEGNTSILDGFTIQNANNPTQYGGGIYCYGSSPTLRNNVLRANIAAYGCAISLKTSSPTIENNKIIGNTGTCGGAIFCQPNCSPTISHNLMMYNSVSYCGGAIYNEFGGTPTIDHNLLIGNSAPNGSGVFIGNGVNAQLSDNTLDRNISTHGSIDLNDGGSALIKNSIISNDLSGYGIYNWGGTATITYCDSWNNSKGNYFGYNPGAGCISANPLFCDTATGNYNLQPSSPCVGTGQGGTNIGAFGIGCSNVSLSAGPDQQGRAITDVSVKFYVTNFSTNDTFNLDITDSLGWVIIPTHYNIPLEAGETDTVTFSISIPYVPIGTTNRLTLIAVSQSDSAISDTASLLVSCNEFAEGVNIMSQDDTTGFADSLVSINFIVQNTGVIQDSYSVDISDTLGWNINPLHFDITLDTTEVESLSIAVNIPYVPLNTADLLIFHVTSKSNPLVQDSDSVTVTCNDYKEEWQVGPRNNIFAPASTHVNAVFYVWNQGIVQDSCSLTVTDSLGWSIDPLNYKLTLDPGEKDSVIFDVSLPYIPVGTTDKLMLSGLSLTNPYVITSASLYVTCNARNIYVPHDFAKIQPAIDFSSNFDSILVNPGTYHEHLNFGGKKIILKSEKGCDSTIVSKLSGGVCMVSFISGEDSNSVIDGFTLTGAILEFGYGAGIKCVNSSPKIINNKIINNRCPLGAGIACENHANPIISNNIIRQNNAGTEGAGIRCNNHSSPLIQQNYIVENTVTGNGGGILCLDNSSPVIVGNLLAKNFAQNGYGGGISLQNSSSATINNNTLDRNSALFGGGIYIDATSSASVINTIITNTPSGKGIRADWLNPLVIYYCDVWNNLDEDYYGCVPGTGSISINPLFCDTSSTDYSLWISSPCLGSGQNGSNIGAFGMGCSVMGDANGDAVIDVGDVVYLINYLFKSGPAPSPLPAGDATCDGNVDVGDVIYLINYLFKSGPPPTCE